MAENVEICANAGRMAPKSLRLQAFPVRKMSLFWAWVRQERAGENGPQAARHARCSGCVVQWAMYPCTLLLCMRVHRGQAVFGGVSYQKVVGVA